MKTTKHNVLIKLAPVDTLWCRIGNGRRVEDNVLQDLAESNISNQDKLSHLLQTWIKMDGHDQYTPVNWKIILDVVKGPLVQKIALANETRIFRTTESYQ